MIIIKKVKTFLWGIIGVIVGIMIISIIRDGEIDWKKIGTLLTFVFLILLFNLGISLYKKDESN